MRIVYSIEQFLPIDTVFLPKLLAFHCFLRGWQSGIFESLVLGIYPVDLALCIICSLGTVMVARLIILKVIKFDHLII